MLTFYKFSPQLNTKHLFIFDILEENRSRILLTTFQWAKQKRCKFLSTPIYNRRLSHWIEFTYLAFDPDNELSEPPSPSSPEVINL
jgi:hypothetical protein